MARYISPEKVDYISQQTDIVQIISQYLPLTKAGKDYKTLCPFHEEKTSSFVISPEKQVFHCFGCGVGGNVFTFLMKWENVSFPEAVGILAKKIGVSVYKEDKDRGPKEQFYRINAQIAEFFHSQIKKNKIAQDYLYDRGLKSKSIDLFKLGWAPSSQVFLSFCRKSNLSRDKLKKLGFLKTSSQNGNDYAYFRERIIFPIFSFSKKTIGFGARVLDESLPKYLNSPSSLIFDKGKNLYGLDLAGEEMRKTKEVILVEGYTDVITLYQEGIHNLVASLGTSLTDSQVRILKRYVDTVFLAYDKDSAGEAVTIRGIDLLLENGLQVKIISFSGKDPADSVRKNGLDAFLEAKEKALSYMDYRIKIDIDNNQPLTLEKKLKIVNSLFFTLKKIKSKHILDDILRKLSQALKLSEESLRSEFNRFCKEKNKFSFSRTLKFEVPKQEEMEKRLLQIMLCDQEAIEVVKDDFPSDNFTHPLCRELAQEIFLCQNDEITPSYLINRTVDETLCSFISSLSFNDPSLQGVNIQQAAGEAVRALIRRKKQSKKEQLTLEMKECEQRGGEEEKVKNLGQQISQLQKSILIRERE